jgi:beta-glucosidase
LNRHPVLIAVVFFLLQFFPKAFAQQVPVHLDSGKPIELRVEALLSMMTLEEKVGQMHVPCVYRKEFGQNPEERLTTCRNFVDGSRMKGIGPVGGLKHTANEMLDKSPREFTEMFNRLQKIAAQKTRLKIPLLQVAEGTHGFKCSGATIFPEGLALGSTWNIELFEQVYAACAREARAVGNHELSTLVVEPIRDPRLGRNQEAFTEDPYLCSRIAEAIVKGCQGYDISAKDRVIAELSHFPGQSEPACGIERGAMEISERQLREVFLPPWEAGIKKAGALGIMATYVAIDGMPAHASEKLLTDILRNELGFKGTVLSEGGGLNSLVYERVAATQKQAGQLAINAGVDIAISLEEGYKLSLVESVREGAVSIEKIDRAVRRILRNKFLLGLFENTYVDPDYTVEVFHCKRHQDLALQAAREGIVLLKNENDLLPLNKNIKSIAVIGPVADDARNQLGDYTASKVTQDIVTVLDGIRNKVSADTEVIYVKGCDVLSSDVNSILEARNLTREPAIVINTGSYDSNNILEARDAAQNTDVAIVVLGEKQHPPDLIGTDGEGFDVATLELTGLQQQLVEAVYQTGTPTIVVLISGRPLAIRWIAENVPAIIQPWMCGEKGGQAVADILFGDYNPSGRLPITVPRHVGQLPVYYNHKPSKPYWVNKGWGITYSDMSPKPLFEFGFGLSYTKFEYSNLKIVPKSPSEKIGINASVLVSMDVKNVGGRKGSEVVQLYISDVLSSITRPVKELKGFKKIALEPGQVGKVVFTLTPYDLSFWNYNMQRVVEPGTFEVMVGSSSEDIRLKDTFEVEK